MSSSSRGNVGLVLAYCDADADCLCLVWQEVYEVLAPGREEWVGRSAGLLDEELCTIIIVVLIAGANAL